MVVTLLPTADAKNPRLSPRFCRRSRILGSDQIAENRAPLEELEAGNSAGGECLPRCARQMTGFAKDSILPAADKPANITKYFY